VNPTETMQPRVTLSCSAQQRHEGHGIWDRLGQGTAVACLIQCLWGAFFLVFFHRFSKGMPLGHKQSQDKD
jgi:hypothetical protein